LLPSTDADSLQALAERLRRQVAETVIDADAGIAGDVDAGPVRLSVSVGGYLCQPGESLDSLLHMADQALYTAKAGGRDRVCITAQSSGKQA
jgi:PleD family two-component response regulator